MLASANNSTEQVGSVRSARRDAGLSQEQLARRADCSTAYVRLIEAGYAPARSDVLPRIAGVLNIEVDDLWPGLPTDPGPTLSIHNEQRPGGQSRALRKPDGSGPDVPPE